MISWWFHPLNITASRRPAGFAKYLPTFGWEPLILCGKWTPETCLYWGPGKYDTDLASADPCEVVRVPWRLEEYPKPPAESLRSQFRWLRFRLASPPTRPKVLYRRMIDVAVPLMEQRRFDAIWATSPDMLPLGVASALSKRFGVPWIADLADIPDQVGIVARSGLSWLWERVKRWRWREAEKAACKTASAIVAPSEPIANIVRARHSQQVVALPNGFDPDLFGQGIRVNHRTFNLAYCGVLYINYRRWDILFDALDTLCTQHRDVARDLRVRLCTSASDELSALLKARPSANLVEISPWVPHREAIRIEQEASALLFLPHYRDKGIITSKLMEYLGTGRPILSVPGDNDVTDAVITETNAGRIARSVEEVVAVLKDWHQEWKQTGTVAFRGDPEKIQQYSWNRRAAQLAEILDQVCSSRK